MRKVLWIMVIMREIIAKVTIRNSLHFMVSPPRLINTKDFTQSLRV